MKKQVFLIIILGIFCVNLFGQLIPDDNFKAKINERLGQPTNYEPTIEDLNGITGEFNAYEAEIVSIEGAQYLTNLTTLKLDRNQIVDISSISNLANLTSLSLYDNQISDISAVSNLVNLIYLSLFSNQIIDINAVSGLISLYGLWLDSNQISDISAVSELSNLSWLYLHTNQISDISAVSNLTNLTILNLYSNQISDISAFSGLSSLNYLRLQLNQISDISAVATLTNLVYLNLHSNQISDISALSDLSNLFYLSLSFNQISDISAVSSLTNLTNLLLYSNQISDISPVSGLTNLTSLKLYSNQISDISAVSGLTNLRRLWMTNNQISDISAVSGLINLSSCLLYSNQISDIYALVENTGLGSEDHLYFYDNPISQEAFDVHIPILENRGFETIMYPTNPNNYAACYPYPNRHEIGLSTDTIMQWSGNFPSRDVDYEVWLGETSDNLIYIGVGIPINNTVYTLTPDLDEETDYWWKIKAITETDTIWSGLWHFTVGYSSSMYDEIHSINASQIVDNFPNPFNPSTTIRYELIESGFTKIEVFNIKGQKINTLINQYQTAGEKSIDWNGIDTRSNPVSSGIYILKLNVNETTQSLQKCVLLK